jgi:L-histidine N-alpha-methyltransferase
LSTFTVGCLIATRARETDPSPEEPPLAVSERSRVLAPATEEEVLEFARAVGIGLSDTPRWLPCRFLYDARGSELFERITEQPEYYPTRTEAAILERSARRIRDLTGPLTLIELGSGSSVKTDHLLREYARDGEPVHYVAVDVSDSILRSARATIRRRHPSVRVTPVVGTYGEAFPLFGRHSPSMALFLGSTIGNFNQTESAWFWEKVTRHMLAGDYFLLGVDLVKDQGVLEAAYNDAAGVTAEFTRNLFVRMNRELGAGVDVDAIEHVARYNAAWRRIEIFARFPTPQTVHVRPLERRHRIRAGEQIMVEISRKFVLRDLTEFVRYFAFHVRAVFTDDRGWFAVVLLQKGQDE